MRRANHAVPTIAAAFVLFVFFVLAGCSPREADEGARTGTLVIRGTTERGTTRQAVLRVEIAETEEARQRGLMGRRRLPPNAGMVFLFDGPTTSSFWMKDTLIPLSIAFWTKGGRIVAILDMAPCREEPCPRYSPGASYIGAVEANRGFFDRAGVRVGDVVQLVRAPT